MNTPDDLLLLIVSSPSGAGKTTLTHRLLAGMPELCFSVSHTTRAPRKNEVDGQDYHFIDKAKFEKMVSEDVFAEWAQVHGNFYGTAISELTSATEKGKTGILFDVDYQGARQIRAKFPTAVAMFILPPSMDELKRRLEGRATDTPETIKRRFEFAPEEIKHYPFFDYLVVNDNLQNALATIKGIVLAERCRRERMAPIAESMLR